VNLLWSVVVFWLVHGVINELLWLILPFAPHR